MKSHRPLVNEKPIAEEAQGETARTVHLMETSIFRLTQLQENDNLCLWVGNTEERRQIEESSCKRTMLRRTRIVYSMIEKRLENVGVIGKGVRSNFKGAF